MTNKELIKEIIWFLACLLACFIVGCFLLPAKSFLIDDLFTDAEEESGTFTNRVNAMTLGFSVVLVMPLLFIVNVVRGAITKFTHRGKTIFLLFTGTISLLFTVVISSAFKTICTLMYGSFMLYPPLSGFREGFSSPEWVDRGLYALFGFIGLHVIILLLLVFRLFKQAAA